MIIITAHNKTDAVKKSFSRGIITMKSIEENR